ncbi:MAG: transposase [Gammaproteobacteria bacterium]|nr:transposase [Gammaproteobacteria bacterium]
MKYDPKIHHRRSIRLKGFDYSQNGAYFLTLCTHNRSCLFGEINNKKMVLNQFGIIVRDEWIKSSLIRREIKMDQFIIMPNHLHGIVFIESARCQNKNGQSSVLRTINNTSIGSLVAGFKSSVTKKIKAIQGVSITSVWQRNYHEHIIRNEKSLDKIREYVIHNPETIAATRIFLITNDLMIFRAGHFIRKLSKGQE